MKVLIRLKDTIGLEQLQLLKEQIDGLIGVDSCLFNSNHNVLTIDYNESKIHSTVFNQIIEDRSQQSDEIEESTSCFQKVKKSIQNVWEYVENESVYKATQRSVPTCCAKVKDHSQQKSYPN